MTIAAPTINELKNFKSMASIDDLAAFLGTSPKQLSFLLYSRRRPIYRTFKILKASGSYRQISSPPLKIRLFQKLILRCMTAMYTRKVPVHGFVSHRSVATNAKNHIGSKSILNIDILNFFPSIHFGRVRGVFQSYPFSFSASIASVLAQICCFENILPQGAPTSPIISNLVCRKLDHDLFSFAQKSVTSPDTACPSEEAAFQKYFFPSGRSETVNVTSVFLAYFSEDNGGVHVPTDGEVV
jgi:RNA-directed DNA polymerase